MSKLKVCAMIAAAGRSSRMGFDKALLPIDRKPAVVFSARAFCAVDPEFLFATLPSHLLSEHWLMAELKRYRCRGITNRFMHHGYSGSIMSVLIKLPSYIDGLLTTPVDSPVACGSLVADMMRVVKKDRATIVVPYYRDRPGHPVFFSRHYFEELFKCSRGPREVIANNQNAVHKILWHDELILSNLNYITDAKRRLK